MKSIFFIILISVSVFGVPAYHGDIEFKQSDNSTFKGKLKGDPWFNWVQTEDGFVAKYNEKSKDYEYMLLNTEDELTYSNEKVTKYINLSRSAPSRSSTQEVSDIKRISSDKMGKIWQKKWVQKRNKPLLK